MLLVSFLLTPSIVSAGSTGAMVPGASVLTNAIGGSFKQAAELNAAVSKFEGLLNAYSVNQKQNIERQLFTAADDLGNSLEQFNAALIEAYPTLSEEQQLAVQGAYAISLRFDLYGDAAKANSVLGREVFKVVDGAPVLYGIDTVQTFGLVISPTMG